MGEDEEDLWKRGEGEGDELMDFKGRECRLSSEFYRSTI
jgi:hypothetical protein